MWTMVVKVTLVRDQRATSVALVVDLHPIGALGADAADEPLGRTVRARRSRWRLDDLDVRGPEHRVERASELGVPVPGPGRPPYDPKMASGGQPRRPAKHVWLGMRSAILTGTHQRASGKGCTWRLPRLAGMPATTTQAIAVPGYPIHPQVEQVGGVRIFQASDVVGESSLEGYGVA